VTDQQANALVQDEMQLVTFDLERESFGINIMNVQEIIRTPNITVIPQAPPYVEGVTNLRGNILPVIDTRVKFNLPPRERDAASRVIVVDVKGRKIGLSVDGVSEVLRVESNQIEPAPAMVSGIETSAISGMVKINDGKKLVMILDAVRFCQLESGEGQDTAAARLTRSEAGFKQEQDKKLEEVQLVTFGLGKEEFALEIEQVREIIRYPEIVKVPNVPAYIKGVISLRDRLLPIVDMRVKLETSSDEVSDTTRVVVVDVDNMQVGLVVDKVYEVTRVPKDTIYPPPQALTTEGREQLKGIVRLDDGKRIIMLIDPFDILTREEIRGISTVETADAESIEEAPAFLDGMDEEQMVVFKLAGEQYGVRITQVQEINRLSKITKVPRAPKFVEGVVNLRGDVIPLIDLRKRFEMEEKEYNEFTRIIVSDINNKKIGIIVDEVLEVLRVPKKNLEEAPDIIQGNQAARFMEGLANLENRMIMLLNLENILVEKEWQKLADLSQSQAAKKTTPVKLKKQGGNE